jgi:hypothetical protein
MNAKIKVLLASRPKMLSEVGRDCMLNGGHAVSY